MARYIIYAIDLDDFQTPAAIQAKIVLPINDISINNDLNNMGIIAQHLSQQKNGLSFAVWGSDERCYVKCYFRGVNNYSHIEDLDKYQIFPQGYEKEFIVPLGR